MSGFDIEKVRSDFPILSREIGGKPLVYLDNGATSQKPRSVIDTLSGFFERENANIHRGVHYLSMNATDAYDRARERIAAAIGAPQVKEVIFVRGTTEAINLVAHGLGETHLSEGDEIVLTLMEHHANFVPWQILAEKKGLKLTFAPVTPSGEVDLDAWKACFTDRTRLASFVHVSNALGTVNPVTEMTEFARERGALVLVDGAQAVPHGPVDVAGIGCDFYAFSGHKVFGPDGIGVLWGKEELLAGFPPYQSGGDMIERVSVSGTTFRGIPERFEAGTPNISGPIGLAAAFDYIDEELGGWKEAEAHESELVTYSTERLLEIEGLEIRGTAPHKIGVISFTMESAHPHDIGTILDSEGVAIRAGHHCCQPLMEHYGITGTARASFAFYNNRADADALVAAVRKVKTFFG